MECQPCTISRETFWFLWFLYYFHKWISLKILYSSMLQPSVGWGVFVLGQQVEEKLQAGDASWCFYVNMFFHQDQISHLLVIFASLTVVIFLVLDFFCLTHGSLKLTLVFKWKPVMNLHQVFLWAQSIFKNISEKCALLGVNLLGRESICWDLLPLW